MHLFLQPIFNCQGTLGSRRSALNSIIRLDSPLNLTVDFVAADHEQRSEGDNHFASSIHAVHGAHGGADRDRTDDPLLAKQVLSQLSYSPIGSRGVGLKIEGPNRRAYRLANFDSQSNSWWA